MHVIKNDFNGAYCYRIRQIRYRSKVTLHSLAIFPRVKRLLNRVTSGSSGEPRKCLTQYSRVGKSRVHRVPSTQKLKALSGRFEGLGQALEIVPSRHVRLVNKPFLVHYADTSSLREYKKTIKQIIHAVLFCDARW